MKKNRQVEKKDFDKMKHEEYLESEKVKFTTNNEESSMIIDDDEVADETESRPASMMRNNYATPQSYSSRPYSALL